MKSRERYNGLSGVALQIRIITLNTNKSLWKKAHYKKELKQEEAKPSKENKTNGFKIETPIGNAQDKLTHIKAQKGNKKEDGTPVKKKQEQSK